MSLHSWLQNLRSALAPGRGQRQLRRRDSRPAATYRPSLEVLEDRRVPAFLAPVNYAAGANPRAVVTADFNNDGRLDLATANYSGNDVSILLGGDSTFQTARNYATGGSPVCIAAGDFNGDGNLDLVTQDGNDSPNSGAIRVLLGNGDGSFQWIGSSSTYSFPQGMAVGDFNGDGILDVAASSSFSNWAGDGASGEVDVFLGKGNGSFSSFSSLGIANGFGSSPVTADFNRDGYADLAWDGGPEGPHGPVQLFLGAGNGTFEFVQSIELDAGAQTLAVADLNGDGKPDLVTDSNVLEDNGDGTFQVTQNYAGGVSVGDFNGDGSLDLLVGNNLLPGNGNDAGTFPAASGRWTLGDFNGDGRWDLVNANGYSANSVSVRLNDGSWDGPPTPLPPSLRIGDSSVTEGNTGTRAATFTVTLSVPRTETITVAYATVDGSGTAGSDYQATSGTLTFAPGETTRTITVLVNGDRVGEPNETFSVILSDPTNAIIDDASGLCEIYDDEPRMSITPSVSRGEGNTGPTPFFFTVTLSSAYDGPVTVDWATAAGSATAGSDYQAASGTLIIPAGQTAGTITVLIHGDRLFEEPDRFFVNLSGATSAVITQRISVGTILDDEPRISISDVSKQEGKKNRTTLFTFTVTLSAAYDQTVTMSFTTVNGTATTSDSDYIAKTGTLTFAPGETTKSITIEVKGDSRKESDETFYLDLFGNSSNSLFTKNRGLGTILNDD